ncbi:MAG: hypothetical protein MI747_16385 [Desulfobacterales bacterium]|nr:hypothetical protein [Desulfobacterales bacterium]
MTCPKAGFRLILLVFTVAIISMGCLGGYGTMKTNLRWLELSQARELPRGYTYYFCGRSNIPYALVGIEPGWTFKSRFWFKVDTMDQVYDLVENLSDLHIDAGEKTAADILTPQGEKVGVWISYYSSSVVQVDAKGKVVSVYNPYNPNEDDRISPWNAP